MSGGAAGASQRYWPVTVFGYALQMASVPALSLTGTWPEAAVLIILERVGKTIRKPFMLVFWSRDPDGTQHNQGDSLKRLVPGIDGPISLDSIANADHDLAGVLAAPKTQGLEATPT